MTLARRLGRVVSTLLLAAGVAFGALLVVPALLGWERYVIVSGSMTGTYDRGSLVLDAVVPTASLKTGDVITYEPPRGEGPGGLLTHRIHAITRTAGGERVYRTQGDANPVPDPWTFTLPHRTQARVVAGVPYAGFAVALLSERRWRMLVVGVPAAMAAVAAVAGLWREEDADLRGAPA